MRDPLVETRPDRRQLLALANRARNRRQDRRAISFYRRVLLEEPHNVEVALRLAPLLAVGGETFEAWQLFRMAAIEFRRERRYEACLAALRDACRFVPHEYDAWRMCAELERKLGRDESAYETLLEGRRHFDRSHTRAQAIALLTQARGIEPWDPEVALDLARLYACTGMEAVALELLESLSRRVRSEDVRRLRALQLRITFSPHHAWLWLRSFQLGAPRPARNEGPVLDPGSLRLSGERRS